jgi:carboxymethylenebutenolidase
MITRIQERLVSLALLTLLAAGTTLSAQSLPASDEASRARLNSSPRHGEWVKVQSGGDTINAWVVYPERSDRAPVVVVIHEMYGLTDWIRAVADQLAAEGYIAIAPDLLGGKGPGGGGTESVDRDGAVALVRGLDRAEVVSRLDATAQYATSLPAAQEKWASIGFCWGGTTSFAYATAQPNLSAAVVYYGSSPSAEALARIQASVLGLYGGDDARVNRTIPPAETEMKRLGKSYQPEIFDGAGHGFLRAQEGRDGANMRATEQAWPETIGFLKKELGS